MEFRQYTTNIAIVGMGGIGSHLLGALAAALHKGPLSESLGGVRFHIFDSDLVDESNTMHQRFAPSDVGRHKVEAMREALSPFTGGSLEIEAHPLDIRSSNDSDEYPMICFEESALVVVCVDSTEARRIAHSHRSPWLDLRCMGDGFVAIDYRVEDETIGLLTIDQPPKSCQLEGAIETGNIQFGYFAAAAHGAQWAIQMLRSMAGERGAMAPMPASTSITFGTLGRLPTKEEPVEVG